MLLSACVVITAESRSFLGVTVTAETCGELPGVWDGIWGVYDGDGTEEYSG
jgi:hypothetical protein